MSQNAHAGALSRHAVRKPKEPGQRDHTEKLSVHGERRPANTQTSQLQLPSDHHAETLNRLGDPPPKSMTHRIHERQ